MLTKESLISSHCGTFPSLLHLSFLLTVAPSSYCSNHLTFSFRHSSFFSRPHLPFHLTVPLLLSIHCDSSPFFPLWHLSFLITVAQLTFLLTVDTGHLSFLLTVTRSFLPTVESLLSTRWGTALYIYCGISHFFSMRHLSRRWMKYFYFLLTGAASFWHNSLFESLGNTTSFSLRHISFPLTVALLLSSHCGTYILSHLFLPRLRSSPRIVSQLLFSSWQFSLRLTVTQLTVLLFSPLDALFFIPQQQNTLFFPDKTAFLCALFISAHVRRYFFSSSSIFPLFFLSSVWHPISIISLWHCDNW